MSFILDALKKSEIERQRQSQPGLMDTPLAQRRVRLPLWAVLLGVLLAVNVVVLLMLMRNGAPALASNPKKHPEAVAVSADKAPAPTEHFSPLDQPPVYAPEIPITAADGASSSNSTASLAAPLGAPHSDARRSAPRPAFRRPDPVLVDEDTEADNEEVLPSISEINLTGAQALPELHLDVHVYATKPAERFVYINMRKYHEGSSLPEGPVVEHIRRDGVVLNYQGLRFILPRQS
jgi:general secretion pathway protein B